MPADAVAHPNAAANGENQIVRTPREIEVSNRKIALGYRQKVAAAFPQGPNIQIINTTGKTEANGTQHTISLYVDNDTGSMGVLETRGLVKHFPRALRAKRTAERDDQDDVDEEAEGEIEGEADGNNVEVAHQWEDDDVVMAQDRERVRAAAPVDGKRKKKKAKKAKTGTGSSAKKGKAAAARGSNDDEHPQNNDPVDDAGLRRSGRLSRGGRSSARNSGAAHEPVIRENQEENHVTASDEFHHVDHDALRRSTRQASDDLASLSDRMNHFEIKSEAGSESTRMFSREPSYADGSFGF